MSDCAVRSHRSLLVVGRAVLALTPGWAYRLRMLKKIARFSFIAGATTAGLFLIVYACIRGSHSRLAGPDGEGGQVLDWPNVPLGPQDPNDITITGNTFQGDTTGRSDVSGPMSLHFDRVGALEQLKGGAEVQFTDADEATWAMTGGTHPKLTLGHHVIALGPGNKA